MDVFWWFAFVLCSVAMTAICSRLLPRIAWWLHAILGCALGLGAYWGLMIAITGHLDKYFLLTIIPLLAISGGIAALTAFVIMGFRR